MYRELYIYIYIHGFFSHKMTKCYPLTVFAHYFKSLLNLNTKQLKLNAKLDYEDCESVTLNVVWSKSPK